MVDLSQLALALAPLCVQICAGEKPCKQLALEANLHKWKLCKQLAPEQICTDRKPCGQLASVDTRSKAAWAKKAFAGSWHQMSTGTSIYANPHGQKKPSRAAWHRLIRCLKFKAAKPPFSFSRGWISVSHFANYLWVNHKADHILLQTLYKKVLKTWME